MNLTERVIQRHFAQTRRAKINVGDTYENGNLRVHRYRDSLVLWDLTNAGKRGKKVERVTVTMAHWADRGPADEDKILNSLGAALDSYDSLARAVSMLKDVLVDYPGSFRLSAYEERGVDVMPAGFEKFTIEGRHVSVEAEYKDFRVRNLDDNANEPTCIPAVRGGVRDIPVFYRWVKDNEDRIKTMNYRQVLQEMEQLGIRYHDYCAMD